MSANINKVYRYPSELQLKFPEGLSEIKFLSEIDGFNYLSIRQNDDNEISLPIEFEETKTPEILLTKIRKKKQDEVEAFRKELQFKAISYQEVEISTSQMARQNILSMIATPSSSKIKYYWRDNKRKNQNFNLNNFQEIISLISSRDTKLYYIEGEIKNLIDDIDDIRILEELKISDLWQEEEIKYQEPKEEISVAPPPPPPVINPKKR